MQEELPEHAIVSSNEQCVVKGSVIVENSTDTHIGPKYIFVYPSADKEIELRPELLDINGVNKTPFQDKTDKNNEVCIVEESKLRIRKLYVLIGGIVIAIISTVAILAAVYATPQTDPEPDRISKTRSESIIDIGIDSIKENNLNKILQTSTADNKTDLLIDIKNINSKYQTSDNEIMKKLKISNKETTLVTKEHFATTTIEPGGPLCLRSREEWNAENATKEYSKFVKTPVPYAIISHTATNSCNDTESCKKILRGVQAFQFGFNFIDIGYNFLVGGDGCAYIGRGWDNEGAHTKAVNNRSIGISFIGNFDKELPPRKQINAVLLLLEEGVRLNKLSRNYKLFAHCQLSATISPGKILTEHIKNWPHWSEYNPGT